MVVENMFPLNSGRFATKLDSYTCLGPTAPILQVCSFLVNGKCMRLLLLYPPRADELPVRLLEHDILIDNAVQTRRSAVKSGVNTFCMYHIHGFNMFQIAFPRPGALGLNLRSYLVQQPAGARHDLPPYGTLKVLDTQNIYLKVSRLHPTASI